MSPDPLRAETFYGSESGSVMASEVGSGSEIIMMAPGFLEENALKKYQDFDINRSIITKN